MDIRQVRAYSILAKGDKPIMVNEETFLVPSQSSDKRYKVAKIDGWSCECMDFLKRKQLCKHIYTIQFWLKLRDGVSQSELIQLDSKENGNKCTYCKSSNIVRNGSRYTKIGTRQRYLCNDCGKRFVNDPIKHVKGNGKIVTLTMDLFFKGLSLRDISDTIHQFYGLKLHHETIRRWIMRFTEKANEYVNKLQPKLSNKWHADEQMIKVKGKWLWNWNVLDSDTRFLIANNITGGREISDARKVFKKTKEIAETNPNEIITDGLFSYEKAIKKEFIPFRTGLEHTRLTTIRNKVNNNKIERFHNTFREFDKIRRGFKAEHTAQSISDGFRTYYNFIRPHSGILNFTPSQMAGIDLELTGNRWLNLIKLSNEDTSKIEKKPFELKTKSHKPMYQLRVFDQNGNELNAKEEGFKERFFSMDIANKFIEFYKDLHPKYEFRVERCEE